jgi:hypothetical protein
MIDGILAGMMTGIWPSIPGAPQMYTRWYGHSRDAENLTFKNWVQRAQFRFATAYHL